MFNVVHSCLTKNFIKLGGVLSRAIAFNNIFFHEYNHILVDEAGNTLIMLFNRLFRVPFTVENSSLIISFSLFGCRHFILPEITKIEFTLT